MSEKLIRTCIACRKKAKKHELLRVVKNDKNQFVLDDDQSLDGRSAYICKTNECIAKCLKTKGLNRSFKQDVGKDICSRLDGLKIDN